MIKDNIGIKDFLQQYPLVSLCPSNNNNLIFEGYLEFIIPAIKYFTFYAA